MSKECVCNRCGLNFEAEATEKQAACPRCGSCDTENL